MSRKSMAGVRPKVMAKTGERCVYCGVLEGVRQQYKTSTHRHLVCDHDIPRSRQGTNHLANLWPACAPCNLEKGAMTAEEFMAAGGRPFDYAAVVL